jgi:hypothetical protein
MTPDARRKLLIAAGSVAAFFGFVALTGWTSSGEMDEQERRELATFCSVLELADDYEGIITTASLAGGQAVFGEGGAIDDGFSNFIQGTLLDYAPGRYREEAERVVEGLDRSLRGELTVDEAESYADDFRRLERRASGDCEQFEGDAPDFGGGSPFGLDADD